jgi:hypothetical protein
VEVTAHFHVRNLAEQAGLHHVFLGVNQVRGTFALGAYLYYFVVLAGGGYHGFAFHHVHTDGLLHVHVGAGLQGVNGLQGVPVIRRADKDDVHFVFGQHFPVVSILLGRFFGFQALTDQCGGAGKQVFVYVAEGYYFYGGYLDQPE